MLRSLRWANVPAVDLGSGMDSVAPDRVRGYPLTKLDRVSHREFGPPNGCSTSALALLVLSPLLLVIAAAVKRRKGPVFFKQERVGGEPINVLKFRSMRVK